MTEFVQRKPFVFLIVLVAANLFLLSVQVRNEEGRLLLRSWQLWVFSPVASALNLVGDGVENTTERWIVLWNAERENKRLRAENARLQLEVNQLRSLRSLISRTEDFELVRDQYLFDTAVAAIIWKSAPFYSHRLLINAGTREGVHKDSAILTAAGIVGRVWATSPFSAEVELLTNAGAAAGGMLQDSRLQGVIQGDGSSLLHWNFIPNYEKVEVGDIVYTSGTDKIYPKGLPIGRVIRSEKSSMIYREIVVKPLVDYSRIEEIMVVLKDRQET